MKKYAVLLIIWLLVIRGSGLAQTVAIDTVQTFVHPPVNMEDESYEEEVDKPEKVELPLLRLLPADTLRVIRSQKDFAYMSRLDSLLRDQSKLETEVTEKVSAPTKSIFDSGFVRTLLWMGAIGIVLFLVYQLLGSQKNLFVRNKKTRVFAEEYPEETERPVSLVQRIQDAVAAGNYRLAVRYQYLYLLDGLAAKKLINKLPQKTNQQYLKELSGEAMRSGFATLTLQYEYIWFGKFEPNKEQYDQVLAGFRNFMEKWL
jgi:hypothetical protein